MYYNYSNNCPLLTYVKVYRKLPELNLSKLVYGDFINFHISQLNERHIVAKNTPFIKRKASRLKGSRTMPPLGFRIYLRPRVTLTFDLLNLNSSIPLPVDYLCHWHQNRLRMHDNVRNRATFSRHRPKPMRVHIIFSKHRILNSHATNVFISK